MTTTQTRQAVPRLIDIGDEVWNEHLKRATSWLRNLALLQGAFRKLAGDAAGSFREPHIRRYLADMADQARNHEERIPLLYQAFSQPVPARSGTGSTALSIIRQGAGHVAGIMGGVHDASWRILRELQLTAVDSTSAFAVTEQLGLAMGIEAVVDVTFPIIRAKTTDQLLLQEYLLEVAPRAILFRVDT